MHVVTIGGGGGQNSLLRALGLLHNRLSITSVTAIPVTTDSGGSSGILRSEHGVVAVGDIGQCIAGLHPNPESIAWLLDNHRFGGEGSLGPHTPRNCIVLAALQRFGHKQKAMDAIQKAFMLRGRIAPVTFDQAHVCARLRNGAELKTEAAIYNADFVASGGIEHLWLEPEPKANPAALRAIQRADAIIVAPGTLACSLVPNFLVKGVREAVAHSSAPIWCITNLIRSRRHEPDGWTPYDHVEMIESHLGDMCAGLICNTEVPTAEQRLAYADQGTLMPAPLYLDPNRRGRTLIATPLLRKVPTTRDLNDPSAHLRASIRHDPHKLAQALHEALVESDSEYLRVAAE